MKKIMILAVSAILSSSLCSATNPFKKNELDNVQFAELEIGCGPMWGRDYQFGDARAGFQGFLEARLNLDSPLDVGLQFSMGKFNRLYENFDQKGYTRNRICVQGFFDYNWRIHPNIAPFIGIGAGGCAAEIYYPVSNNSSFSKEREGRFVITPRIGVEVFSHFRVTFEYKFMASNKYSYGGINFSWAFWGQHKQSRSLRK